MAWKKGQSGNPGGKPKGQTGRGKFRQQVEAALPGIVADLVTAAQGGDMQAVKMILDRTIPSLKPTSDIQAIAVPADADLVTRGQAVIAAATAGSLPMDYAKDLMSVLSAQRALVEQSELLTRLDAIEQFLRQTPNREPIK